MTEGMNFRVLNAAGEVQWELDLTTELEFGIGLAAGLISLIADMNESSNKEGWLLSYSVNLSSYLLAQDVRGELEVPPFTQHTYGIWLRTTPGSYNCFLFDTPRFLDGLIAACQTFGSDFRNYLYGLPFNKRGKGFVIDGYRMGLLSQVPAYVGNLEDVEAEEADNENLITPVINNDD